MAAISRRRFIRDGAAAVAISYTAPAFLTDIANAQGIGGRNLVVLYLAGGNDALNTVVPYTDSFYYSRRPNIAIPAGQVLQVGSDGAGRALGLHPRLTGLRDIFNEGRLAIVQRTGYENSSRSHFEGTDIWSTADPRMGTSTGWLGRYLDALGTREILTAWNTTRETPRALVARTVGVPSIPDARSYNFASPNRGAESAAEREAAIRMASDSTRPHLAFVNSSTLGAFSTLDRVAQVGSYQPSVTYPNSGLGLALRTVAGAMVNGTGTRVFWVSTGGYDTHAAQGNGGGGGYANLMTTVNDAVFAFYSDLRNQGLLGSTMLMQFSEFGRRITENGSQGTDHGAAATMIVAGGAVRGGLYGTAPVLDPSPGNPTLENAGGDVRYETDFRSVYAKVLDDWLGIDSVSVLGGNFRAGAPAIV
jgi:uncharacterized protein (DUF1501 family)